jgi:hypothetical protein
MHHEELISEVAPTAGHRSPENLSNIGVSINGGTPIEGGFLMENPEHKWMILG